MITDTQSLKAVKSKSGNAIKIYDDGFGPLWIYRDSMGIVGVVRAQNFESAYDCILDEILVPLSCDEERANKEDIYVCERDYHCNAPKDFDRGYCLCYLKEHSKQRICWRCKQQLTDHDPKQCKRTEPKRLDHKVYLTLAKGYAYQPNFEESGIVETDLNGESLEILTSDLANALELTIEIEKGDY